MIIFILKPHLLGFGENPEILTASDIVMVDQDGFPLKEWAHLEGKYGCKFWIKQRKLISFIEQRKVHYQIIINESEEFLEKYQAKKTDIENRLKELDAVINYDEKISIPTLRRSNLAAELRTLEKERINHLQNIPFYERAVLENEEQSKSATVILAAIRLRHSHCFDDKSSDK